MRINRTGRSAGIQKSGGKSKASSASKGSDSVKVSDAASLREKALDMLGEMSAVRLDRIEEIRNALESDSFKSDSRKVAVRIVSNALAEHPWG